MIRRCGGNAAGGVGETFRLTRGAILQGGFATEMRREAGIIPAIIAAAVGGWCDKVAERMAGRPPKESRAE